ncbi:hypothetical protein D3C71_2149000 [compost metagenome]
MFTTTVTCAVVPPKVASMVAIPFSPVKVTTPSASTIATFSLLDVQVAPIIAWFVPSEK